VRFLAKITIPKRVADEAAKNGTLLRTLQAAMDELKPETAYFFEQDGDRECLLVVNLDVEAMLKPLFPNLRPTIFVTPVVNAAEFQQGLGEESRQQFAEKSDFLADLNREASRSPESQRGVSGSEGPVTPRSAADELAAKRVPRD
jgi:hypothetical protein